jgi:hypothetical protein
MDFKNTDATRYLCATAYRDSNFRDMVIKETLEEKYKAIGINYGVDLPTVLKHCLAAKNQQFVRDIILGIISVILVVSSSINLSITFAVYFIAWLILFLDTWNTRYVILAKHLSKKNFPSFSPRYKSNKQIELKIQKLAHEQNKNVIVYGGFSPFVGSGVDIGGWSFALNTDESKDKNLKTKYFDVQELYDFIVDDIIKLDIYGLDIREQIFVNGGEIRDNRQFLPDILNQPCSNLEQFVINRFINANTRHIRYYKLFQIVSWNGEIVFSVFFRLFKLKNKLFIEVNNFLLLPLYPYYKVVDDVKQKWFIEKLLIVALETLISSLIQLYVAFTRIFSVFDFLHKIKLRKLVWETPSFNYGATTSIREKTSNTNFAQYFQMLDKEMYLKIIQRQIIDSLYNFLDNKNIDTYDLKQRENTIFNSGVIISGGTIKTTNFSVGKNATTVMNKVFKRD